LHLSYLVHAHGGVGGVWILALRPLTGGRFDLGSWFLAAHCVTVAACVFLGSRRCPFFGMGICVSNQPGLSLCSPSSSSACMGIFSGRDHHTKGGHEGSE